MKKKIKIVIIRRKRESSANNVPPGKKMAVQWVRCGVLCGIWEWELSTVTLTPGEGRGLVLACWSLSPTEPCLESFRIPFS